MPVYEYRVRDRGGKVLTSTMEAESPAQVRDALRAKNLTIVEIKPPKTGMNADIKIPGLTDRPPNMKEVAIFSKQLATLINAGVPIVQSLTILQKQMESKAFQGILRDIRGQVEGGTPLSDTLAQHPKVFDRLFINLVRAGETSGTLDSVLERIADFQEKQLALNGKIKSALTYPAIVLVFAIIITYGLIAFVVPTFASMLDSVQGKLPVITQMVMALSYFLRHALLGIIVATIALIFAYRWYYRTPVGRRMVDALKLRVPLFGPLIKKTSVASFARTFGLLINSGVNIIESLEITKGTANNAIVEETIENAKNVVMVGEQMSSSLATSPVFPPMVVSMVAIGEETGSLDTMLGKVADFYDREVDEAVEGLTAAIEPIMIVLLGGVVLVIILAMFLPMISLMNTLMK
ncbi:type II secretion system F family protein [Deinococcus sp.]|uniref:type II secretion system F family protein n=1 Tax=Deinococcus sp. TaxID=47478 RepID=UPI0025B9C1E1|nr:type II secretion system F family protein [Deinococcus sp.]